MEIIDRINKLKADDRGQGSLIGIVNAPLSQVSRNMSQPMHSNAHQAVTAPQAMAKQGPLCVERHEHDPMTGRSENVQETHRSSVMDQRHQE